MNHDITHCNRNRCPRKDTCHRYKAFLDVKKGHYKGLISIYMGDHENCGLYWKEGGER